jgi:hypothetical protein
MSAYYISGIVLGVFQMLSQSEFSVSLPEYGIFKLQVEENDPT